MARRSVHRNMRGLLARGLMARGLIGLVLFTACESSAPPATVPPSAPSVAASAVALSASAGSGAPSSSVGFATAQPTAVSEADVRALVDRWTLSQNQGNFDDYQSLFAERFTGVKRMANQTRRYNRKNWLQDRAQMFAREFVVKAAGLRLAVTGESAVVQFTQTWSSAKFLDTGPKRLVLARMGDGLKIASEEMLQSTVGGAAQDLQPPRPRECAMVWEDSLVVGKLESLNAVTGHPQYVSNVVATRTVELNGVAEVREGAGRTEV